jgi:protein SCO1/2
MLKRFLLLLLLLAPVWADGPLGVGQTVPDFTLTNQDGKPVALKSFRGKAVLLTFLYTRCPYPDKCPMIASKLSQLRVVADKMGDAKDRFEIMVVSIDPKKDTPEVLKKYASRLQGSQSGYTFLTGKPADIARVAGGFGVLYWDDEKGVIDHNLRTALIDPKGKVYAILPGSDCKVEEVSAKVKEMLSK